MAQNHNEGHPGFVVGQMLEASKESIKQNPDVVLLFVGSNDMAKATSATKAPATMGNTIDGLLKAAPGTAILVAQITASKDNVENTRIEKYDKDLEEVVKQRASAGKHVALVDMSKLLNSKTDYKDKLHPNDAGFKKIANAFYAGLESIDKKGWLKDAGKGNSTTTKTDKTASHDSDASESNKAKNNHSKATFKDGSKVDTTSSAKTHKDATDESDAQTTKTVKTGPNGTDTTKASASHDASTANSNEAAQKKTTKINADGSKQTDSVESEEARKEAEEANQKSTATTTKNPDGTISSVTSESSSDASNSADSSHFSSSSETISKRSAKFRLM